MQIESPVLESLLEPPPQDSGLLPPNESEVRLFGIDNCFPTGEGVGDSRLSFETSNGLLSLGGEEIPSERLSETSSRIFARIEANRSPTPPSAPPRCSALEVLSLKASHLSTKNELLQKTLESLKLKEKLLEEVKALAKRELLAMMRIDHPEFDEFMGRHCLVRGNNANPNVRALKEKIKRLEHERLLRMCH